MDVNINDIDAWKEVRARVDSLASGIFLVSGTALSLSMYVFLNFKLNATSVVLNTDIQYLTESAWYCLLGCILFFALLKAHLILQCFHASDAPVGVQCHNTDKNNMIALLIGVIGLVFFLFGMVLLVKAAAMTLYA